MIIFALANNNRAQAQHITPAGLIHQNPCNQTADPSKAIEHHILRLRQRFNIRTNNILQFISDKLIDTAAIANALILDHHLAQIQMGRAELQFGDSFNHWR